MLLAKDQIERFVRRHLEKRSLCLRLSQKEGSPLYILEPDVLRARARRFSRAFGEQFPDCRFYFAVKSNHHPAVCQTLLEEGFGLDVSSGKELETALALSAGDVIFTGPGKTDSELALAVKNFGTVTILIDSFRELQALEGFAAAGGAVVRAGVRLCTQPTGLWRKFGIPLDGLPDFFETAQGCPHVDLQGIQFHTSWNLSPKAQTDFITLLGNKLATLPAPMVEKIRFVDVGGGYWPEPGEWIRLVRPAMDGTGAAASQAADPNRCHRPAVPIETFAEELGRAVKVHLGFLSPCRVCFEPGRWICNDAMHLMMTVMDKKAPDLVVTDAGINAIGWERFDTDYFPILNLSNPSLSEKPCQICGSLCTPEDHFGFSYFGDRIDCGDLLLLPCQGAYTYSLKQEFIKPTPKVVVLERRGEGPRTADGEGGDSL